MFSTEYKERIGGSGASEARNSAKNSAKHTILKKSFLNTTYELNRFWIPGRGHNGIANRADLLEDRSEARPKYRSKAPEIRIRGWRNEPTIGTEK